MTRKGFLSALAAIAAAPFVKAEQPKNELPREREITPKDVENFVQKEIDRRLTMKVNGKDLFVTLENYQRKPLI